MSKHFWSSAISSEEKSPLFNHNFVKGKKSTWVSVRKWPDQKTSPLLEGFFHRSSNAKLFSSLWRNVMMSGLQSKKQKQIGDGYAGVLSNNLCHLSFWRGSTNGLELLPNQNINLPHAEKWTFPSELLFFLINQRPNIFKCEEKSSNRECTNQQPQLGDTREPVFGDDAVC